MQHTRRKLLLASGSALAGVSLAGCSSETDDSQSDDDNKDDTDAERNDDTGESDEQDEQERSYEAVDIGTVSEWNAIRTRLRDPVILGHAGAYGPAETVVSDIFERFETASGEHNAHEFLEETDESYYEGFEQALGELRTALADEDLEGAHEAMRTADGNLKSAQAAVTDDSLQDSLTLLVMATHVEDGRILLSLEQFGEAAHEFNHIGDAFDKKGLYDTVAEADQGAADSFVEATTEAATAADEEDIAAATEAADEAFEAAIQALYALEPESIAGAIHIAALQARGWDGATVAVAGGPALSYAHAASLNEYRARARDAVWLAENGATERAAATIQRGLERFETARAHDALEAADEESYEAFEGGLEELHAALEAGDDDGVQSALETVDSALRSGITALASEEMAAALEAGYSRIRVADASEQYKTGEPDRAREMVQNVFGDFEANASEFHETLEETDEGLYETFEHDHLEGLISAIENGNDDAVRTHVEGVHETLMQFEEQILPTAAVSGVEGGYLAARALDAAGVAALGNTETARTVVSDALAYFERGAAGFHDAIEQADEERYESFETGLETLEDEIGADSTTAADTAVSRAIEAVYAVIEVGGSGAEAASPLLSDIFAHFEEARVHDLVEEADQDSYEAFESALDGYIKGLEDGKRPDEYVSTYAESCLQVQFAVAGAPDEAPANPGGGEETSDDGEDTTLEGGPNVVEGVPDEADHVVDLQAVAFEPAELTIQQGETVAWRFAAGEAHNVVAYESELPVDADYWASGGFESESAAREGWENGRGAVQSGQSYVKTFETAGEYEYFCVPHEAAGMVGTIIVEG